MSSTHFEINKKLGWTILVFLLTIILTMVGFGVDQHLEANAETKCDLEDADAVQVLAIQINQKAIQASTEEILFNRQNIAVEKERVNGHVGNKTAHD